MAPKSKPKNSLNQSIVDILMPQLPMVQYGSPLSPTEIVTILQALGPREPLTAKVERIDTPTGTLYKFQMIQRYTVTSRGSSSPKTAIATSLGDPLSREGERGQQGVLTGIIQATANNQSLISFNPGRQIIGCLIIAWGVLLLFGILVLPVTTIVKGLLAVMLFLIGVLIFLVMPQPQNVDAGYHFTSGDRLGDFMLTTLKMKRLYRKSAATPAQQTSK